MLPFFSCLAIKLSSSISFYEYRTVAGHIERAVCKSRRTKILIQEMFPSVLSNAADRNRLPRRKIDVHGAQIRHLPTLSVCRDQRDTATVPSDIGQRHFGNKIAVWHIRKRLKRIVPKGDRRQRNFIRAFPNGIKCRIRINLDLFTRQNGNLTARNGCTPTNSKPARFGTVFGKVNVPSAELAGGRSETVSGVSAEKIIFFAFGT